MGKGYFFTLDAFIAIGIIIFGMLIILSYQQFLPSREQSYAYARDTVEMFTNARLSELNIPYIQTLIQNKTIENPQATLLEQVGAFYYQNTTNSMTYLRWMLEIVTNNLVEREYGVGFYVNAQPVFERNITGRRPSIIVPSKVLVMGVHNSTDLWGPYQVEVRVWR